MRKIKTSAEKELTESTIKNMYGICSKCGKIFMSEREEVDHYLYGNKKRNCYMSKEELEDFEDEDFDV